MAPQLQVLVSGSSAYPPNKPLSVNAVQPTPIKTPDFEGEINVWVKDFDGKGKGGEGEEYFGKRETMTYAIVVRGRFLNESDGDEVMFGNVFEKPIRDSLPWGTAVAVRFAYFVDPNLQHDIYADKPWALSPMLASMTTLSIADSKPESSPVVEEEVLGYLEKKLKIVDAPDEQGDEVQDIAARKKWMGVAESRRKIKLGKDVWVGMEFTNGLLDFNTLSITLPSPFNLSIPLTKYWDGQPVTYVCRKRPKKGQDPADPEGVYFSIGFEIIDEDMKAELEKRGGAVTKLGGSGSTTPGETHAPEEGAETSDDVD